MKKQKYLMFSIIAIFAAVVVALIVPASREAISSLSSGSALSGSSFINLLHSESDSNVYYDTDTHTVTIECKSIEDRVVPVKVDDKVFYGAGEENAIVLTIIVQNNTEKDMVASLSDTTLASFDSMENIHAYAVYANTQDEFMCETINQGDELAIQIRYVLLDDSKDANGIFSINIVVENI